MALAGSSGVGKSTLANALTGAALATRGIREDDARGRHTTTARSLHRTRAGGWLIDTPGMRALRLADVAEGIEAVFDDIAALARGCRFGDCGHDDEPGCAVQAAIAAGRARSGAAGALAEARARGRAQQRDARRDAGARAGAGPLLPLGQAGDQAAEGLTRFTVRERRAAAGSSVGSASWPGRKHDLHRIPTAGRLNRRWFLVASGAALAAPAIGRPVLAQATEAHRFTLGDDRGAGAQRRPPDPARRHPRPSAPPEEFAALMTEIHGSVPETITPAANVALLRTGDDLVLVDNGSGNKFQPTAGKLAREPGGQRHRPGAVTQVVFTHAHPDHVWGTLGDDGSLAFPNAGYYVGQAEWDFWTDPDLPAQMPEDLRPFAVGAQRDLGGGQGARHAGEGGRCHRARGQRDRHPGHTPGHVALLVEGGDGLIIGADVAPHEVVSLRHPDWAFGFDADPEQGIATRKALLDRAATDGTLYLGFHFTYPGVGRIERDGGGFRFAT